MAKNPVKSAMKSKLPVASVSPAMTDAPAKMPEDMIYKAKYALEDIERAESHKRDKNLMKHVKKAAKEKIKCLKEV